MHRRNDAMMNETPNDSKASAPNYFLCTEHLGFRLWSDDDIDLALGLWGDVDVTKLIDARGRLTNEQVQERLSREIAIATSHGVQYWPMFLLANGEHVGCCGLRPYNLSGKIYEIGFHIRSQHWGSGFASEGARAVMEYAFGKLAVSGLFAGHHPENEASRRLLKKLGFRYTHDEYYSPTGLRHPCYMLTAAEYAEIKGHRS